MTDQSKRQTLKLMASTLPMMALPAIAMEQSDTTAQIADVESSVSLGAKDQRFSIELLFEGAEASVRITNESDQVAVVKHVYPGIVHAGHNSYDINSIFENSACGIAAGRSRTFHLEPVSHTQTERDFPRHLFSNRPLTIASVTGSDERGTVVQSTRTVYC